MPWTAPRARRYFRQRPPALFDLQDEFLVPDPNPLVLPRICEPGPGTLFWTDLDNQLSVNFGALQLAGGSAAWDRTNLYSKNSFQRKAGRFLEFELTPQNLQYLRAGWQNAATGLIGNNVALIYFSGSGNIEVVDDLDVMIVAYPYVTLSTSYRGRVYDTGDGFNYYINEQPSTSWTLLWRKELSPSRLDTIWPAVMSIDLQGTMQWLRIKQGRAVPPRVFLRQPDANRFYDGAADGVIDCHFLKPASGSPGFYFRYTDANNHWKLVLNIAGATMDLVRVQAGVTTVVGTTAVTVGTGTECKLRVVCFGQYIRSFFGQRQGTATTNAFNSTATMLGTTADGTYRLLRQDTGGVIPDQ